MDGKQRAMRNLTIKRKKTFVACLVKVRIFIEDEQGDFVLDNIKCRQIGILKNGEEDTYPISNERIKLFAVFCRTAPQKFHTVYQISADSLNMDLELFIGPECNPMAGNPFHIFTKEHHEN